MWRRPQLYDAEPDVRRILETLMRMDAKLDRIVDAVEEDGEEEEEGP